MKPHDDIRNVPFLKILPIVIAGIVTADNLTLPVWATTTTAVVAFIAAAMLHGRRIAGDISLVLFILLFSACSATLDKPRLLLPYGEELAVIMSISDTEPPSGRWCKYTATVHEFRIAAPTGKAHLPTDMHINDNTDSWQKADEKVILRTDTAIHLRPGMKLVATGHASAIGSGEYADYGRLMQRRGYGCAFWIDRRQKIEPLPTAVHSPTVLAGKMRTAAAERLSRLHLSPGSAQTVSAMSIGVRGKMPSALREDYGITGASHLLAVSGLHVGIVMMLANLLLWPLAALRHGHIIKNVAAIILIWCYAMLTGLSPSVVRAAAMFSGAQLALAASRPAARANILLATASLMLLIRPGYLYDVSFQLSFAAVAGIFALYRPLYGAVRSRYRLPNALWSVFMVGLSATIATMPLAAHYFGRLPLIGIIINPPLILSANIIVLVGITWIILPVEFLNRAVAGLLEWTAQFQNDLISFCADMPWAYIPFRPDGWTTAAIYAAMATVFILVKYRHSGNSHKSPASQTRYPDGDAPYV